MARKYFILLDQVIEFNHFNISKILKNSLTCGSLGLSIIIIGIFRSWAAFIFEKEPLPNNSPLWQNPKIKITPHVASLTYAEESIRQALENFRRVTNGSAPLNEVSRENMY